MTDGKTVDERPTLRLSQDTWDREATPQELVRLATQIGRRLVIVRRDGQEWSPETDDADW